MSNAVTATGILIQRAPIGDPENFQDVGEITEVDPGGKSRNKIETSTHNEGTESHVLGIIRQTDPTFKVNYVASDATHIAVQSDFDNNVKSSWRILFPSGLYRKGLGYVQMFKYHPAPLDAKQGADIALTWAGPVTEGS